jgi:hypothetical protein
MIKRPAFCAILLICLCALCSAGAVAAAEFNFSIDIPEGWWRLKSDKYLVITRDGAFRHYILVQERPLSLPFKNTGKLMQPTHLPNEAARIVIDEISADPNLTDLQMIENNPATVAGRPGFQLTFLYADPSGMIFKTVYYGCIHGNHFYNLRYSASAEEYFGQTAWREFVGVRNSLKIDFPATYE